MILLITCAWILYEAVLRIIGEPFVDPSVLGFAVMIIAIIIDVSRWRALSKIAKKHESQALEADALHFSSDVLSSSVVIAGLVFVRLGYPIGDPLSAIGVAIVVFFLCWRMGKKTYNSLVDVRLPPEEEKKIMGILAAHKGEFVEFHKFRTRQAGAERHIDLHLVVWREQPVQEAHDLCESIEHEIEKALRNSHVLIHLEPCKGECKKCPTAAPCEEWRSEK